MARSGDWISFNLFSLFYAGKHRLGEVNAPALVCAAMKVSERVRGCVCYNVLLSHTSRFPAAWCLLPLVIR